MIDAATVAAASLPELERLYTGAPLAPLPGGVWRGRYLHELPMPLGEKLIARAMFKWPTFGLDLDAPGWWFGSPARVVGRFTPVVGPSRWRDTEVVRLDYRRTTPWPLSRLLYDELRPLSPDLILGLGGINRSGERGAWFYFALTPVAWN
jgi:hypothetical protein